MTEERFRNHPTIIVQHLAIITFAMIFAMVNLLMSDFLIGIIVMLVILGVALVFIILYWARRYITFHENEAIVESNIIYKKRKTIPYSKIGSVNLTRGVFNQIFGTTTLSVFVNTSANPKVPEARFTLEMSLAEQIKKDLSKGVFDQHEDTHDDKQYESVIKFSTGDVILHSILGMPTYNLMFGYLMIAYTLLSAIFLEGAGLLPALMLFAITQPIPIVMSILKYLNFKIYRIGDQIHVQHGTIQKFVSKFDVKRINAIRVRRPLFARMIGKSCLEAEVVGINVDSQETIPLLCLMSSKSEIERTIRELVPEFIYDVKTIEQPKSARFPLLFKAIIGSFITIVILAYPAYDLYMDPYDFGMLSDIKIMFIQYFFVGVIAICILLLFYAAHVSFRIKTLSKGDSLCTVVNGILDRQIITMQYDRIQIIEVSSSPTARRFGLARGTARLLSSMGTKKITTGYFPKEELDEVSDIMLERLKNGEYDYKKNSI